MIPRRGMIVLGGCAAAVLVGGCAGGSAGDARLRPVCAPNDAGAVELEVPAPAGDSLRFRLRLTGRIGDYAGRRVDVSGPDDPKAYAQWCGAGGCRVVRSGSPTVATFGPLRGDSSVAVRLATTLPDGRPFRWSGVARWQARDVTACG
jgi:hypothetical protein